MRIGELGGRKRRRVKRRNLGLDCVFLLLLHVLLSTTTTSTIVIGFQAAATTKRNAPWWTTTTLLHTQQQRVWGGSRQESKLAVSVTDATSEEQTTATTTGGAPDAGTLTVGRNIGSGSYGTVHVLEVDGKPAYVGKRAWTAAELQNEDDDKQSKERAKRCRVYWQVEVHSFDKLPAHASLPAYYGVERVEDEHDWMVFELLEAEESIIAPSLLDVLGKEQQGRRRTSTDEVDLHHLTQVALALGQDAETPLEETLDVILQELLECLVHLHQHKIVHRDIKPGNLLITPGSTTNGDDTSSVGRIRLIDFGSAADLDTAGLLGKKIGLDNDKVAISPIYTAPELFVDAGVPRTALTFDCFSAALLFCQLLFQLVDERTDAGFHQQLADAKWDLDTWLQREMLAKVRPVGLVDALQVLEVRPGLWSLLQDMLQEDPRDRISSDNALAQLQHLQRSYWASEPAAGTRSSAQNAVIVEEEQEIDDMRALTGLLDGKFLQEVLETMDFCEIAAVEEQATLETPTSALLQQRPLEFVASFKRSESLGLILSELDEEEEYDYEGNDKAQLQWEQATQNALPGEVFVRDIVPGGQAERMGIFEVGDRLQGVGEIPLAQGGFERAVDMLQAQPRSLKYVTLHFDRKSRAAAATGGGLMSRIRNPFWTGATTTSAVAVSDQGAWSTQGPRSTQEDAFVVQELHDNDHSRSILLAGVMDGHGGKAASTFVRETLPDLFSNELSVGQRVEVFGSSREGEAQAVAAALERAWNSTCDMYRAECQSEEACAAEYDAREGILQAQTGAENFAAGTTCSLMALDCQTAVLTLLNCGDSRTVGLDAKGELWFQTADHTPDAEYWRFQQGIDEGYPFYSLPECSQNTWRVSVGEYAYAVARSLEGPFASAHGIVSTADVTSLPSVPGGMTVLSATDGLWEVIDTDEAMHILHTVRYQQGMSAGDAAKTLCSLASEKGSSDNVSCVVLYLD